MCSKTATIVIRIACFSGAVLGSRAPAAEASDLALPTVSTEASVSPFTPLQLDFVRGWIKQHVPACPENVAVAAAERFLQELQQRTPEKLEQVSSPEFPIREYESELYRHVGTQLAGGAPGALREDVARLRVQSLLEKEGVAPSVASGEAGELIEKIRDISSVHHRRLVEGRTEDDDLVLLLRRARRSDEAPQAGAQPTAERKPTTAAEIVSEYARENQQGSALQRLRAYTIEGRLTTTTGEEGTILISRLRPNRFRLVLTGKDTKQHVLAFDGQRYWQQAPGQPAQIVGRDNVGVRRYLGEFIDLLFGEGGADFERVDDASIDGKSVYRLVVRRVDGSRYIARVDPETFRQVGRENEDQTVSVYSDFREVAGVMVAFKEDMTDAQGRKGSFELLRLDPNPGLIQAFFEPPKPTKLDYFSLEQALRQATPGDTGKGQ